MKKCVFVFILIALFSSCKNAAIKIPTCLNWKDTLVFSEINLNFSTNVKHWNAILYTTTQPYFLTTKYYSNTLNICTLKNTGCTEGNAQLCLQSGDKTYFYSTYIKNNLTDSILKKDYRSPKTVNPDSSLKQQQILHHIDKYRNLIKLNNNNYFYETDLKINPKAGIFRAQNDKPISSYYVQAGSCLPFIISAKLNIITNNYDITAGPFFDKYKNPIPDGTLVIFNYNKANNNGQVSNVIQNKYCIVHLPKFEGENCILKAKVNNTFSNSLKLNN